MKTTLQKMITAVLLGIAFAFLAGCAHGIKVPPGSLDYWHHTDSYGPFKDDVLVENAIKLEDGTFVLGHYVGSAQAMGQGPSDEIRNLHVNADGKPVAPTPASTAAVQRLRTAQAGGSP